MTSAEFPDDIEPNGAVLLAPDSHNPLRTQAFENTLANSGVGYWINERVGKFTEVIKPTALYVTTDTDHKVAWVFHKGVSISTDETLRPYEVFHVVCDCAAEADRPSAHPSEVKFCEDVQNVLLQRASDLGKELRYPETLAALTEFDEDLQDFRLTSLGHMLAISAIASLLETDVKHPEQWMANRLNGLHQIEILATFLSLSSSEIMPLLEDMEAAEVIEMHLGTVSLANGVLQ